MSTAKNSGTEGRDAYLIEKAKEAGFDIEVVALGASEVTERMIAEKNNPLCDGRQENRLFVTLHLD